MTTADPQVEGVYGPYSITETDRRDVQRPKPQIVALIDGPFRPGQPSISRRRRHVAAVLAHDTI